jgi:hypothetical protein
MDTGDFKVYSASKDVVKDYVVAYAERMKGFIGKMDAELYWAAGTPEGAGIYVGELEGELITGIAMIQHNESYSWVGLY